MQGEVKNVRVVGVYGSVSKSPPWQEIHDGKRNLLILQRHLSANLGYRIFRPFVRWYLDMHKCS